MSQYGAFHAPSIKAACHAHAESILSKRICFAQGCLSTNAFSAPTVKRVVTENAKSLVAKRKGGFAFAKRISTLSPETATPWKS
ncbi:hypothetical protein OCT63_19855 [Vibrio sp. RW]|uniref:hypothetical protein n=1 Tax=Vibrio sp. RW TaxID=2998833 RepID=UPI0022CD80AB|nr:hypothetical protein [Vibrio sp. RW]MDA0146485.1 hypothetical protein [Vibrio sp. RW]